MSRPDDKRLSRIEEFLERYGLRVENAALVSQALTHRSYAFENNGIPDNERLEFLGDAILGCVVADYLCRRYPDDDEGALSRKKGFLVSRRELGRRADEMGLADLILLGRGEESSGGRARSSVVGSALEALIGALFGQISFDELREFIHSRILEPNREAIENNAHLDFKSRLQELAQKRFQAVPEYRKTREEGPAHDRTFVMEVYVDGVLRGVGEGQRIKTAENRAARQAYEQMIQESSS
ncbi:ribonuclease III [Candidatus Sumerlaeota bacterium]|nr:ribonuclease III [Candidatus Sumerlaeota bacterium]